jgi:hypothetical protein
MRSIDTLGNAYGVNPATVGANGSESLGCGLNGGPFTPTSVG